MSALRNLKKDASFSKIFSENSEELSEVGSMIVSNLWGVNFEYFLLVGLLLFVNSLTAFFSSNEIIG